MYLDFSDSNSPEESTSLPENDNLTNCTQSCDIDLHLPDHSEGREEKRVAQQGVDVIVDTTAIEQSMELTQKLSSTSICKSMHAVEFIWRESIEYSIPPKEHSVYLCMQGPFACMFNLANVLPWHVEFKSLLFICQLPTVR